MQRNALRYAIDALLYAHLAGALVVGLLLAFVIPRGRGANKYFLGLHRHEWSDIHLYLSLVLVALVVVHLVLNWGWVTKITERMFQGKRRVLWLLALSWLPLLAVCWLVAYLA
jgi:hypothetical protein